MRGELCRLGMSAAGEQNSAPIDHFGEMGLPRRAALDSGTVRERFQELSRRCHPDSGSEPDGEAFERLNRSQAELSSPPRRTWHLLELTFGGEALEKKGEISGQLIDLFSTVGRTVANAAAFLRKRDGVSTDLGRALLQGESMEIQTELSSVIAEIGTAIGEYEEKLPGLDEMIENASAEAVAAGLEIWRALTFLEKWKAQAQEKFAQMF